MKRAPLFAVLIMLCLYGTARPAYRNTHIVQPVVIYTDSSLLHTASIDEMLSDVMSVTGLLNNVELKEANVLNIEASVSHHKRYILYNREFISWVNHSTKDKWGVLALLAHEMGHHLNGHTLNKRGSNPAAELEADEFSGFVLYKLGASLEQAQEVMFYIANTTTSSTHPDRYLRMKAIEKGWNKAKN
jgi:hypothetical protein